MTTNAPTANSTPVFDTAYVAHVFNQRGYHINEFASRLDMSNGIVEAFLRGTVEPGDLRIATLANMANLLGIPLNSMFARPEPLPDPDTVPTGDEHLGEEDAGADAEQLVVCVYDTGRATPTLLSEVAKAFDWTLDRTYAAAKEANRRLQPAGLAVRTSHGELFVTPVNEHLDAYNALTNRKVYERGLNYNHYRAAHQIISGQPVTVANSARQRLLTLGGMVNIGVLTQAKNPALTDEALEAFL
jgi:transcriptional regulator with XRE-family HTH domain